MKQKYLGFFSLLIAILGIGIPIAWDYWGNMYSLTLFKNSERIVLASESKIPGLKFEYLGKNVDNLNTTRFKFINSGNKYIEKDDVVEKIIIRFETKDVLDIKVVEASPQNISFSFSKLKDNAISFDFKLLNSNDYVTFDIISNGAINNFSSSARIKNIYSIVDIDLELDPPFFQRATLYEWLVTPISILILFQIYRALRKVIIPIRTTAYMVKNKLEQGFNKEELIPLIEKSTEGLLLERTREKIQARLNKLDTSNEEEFEKFKFNVYIDLLNQDISGSAIFYLLGLVIWVFYNISTLVTTLIF